MSFYQRYELARLIADGETKTFRAVENATGRSVLFHFFNPEGQPILAALKSKLGSVPGKPRPPLLEMGEFAGTPYAVTEMIEPFTTLRQWMQAIEGGALPVAAAPAVSAGPPITAPSPAVAPSPVVLGSHPLESRPTQPRPAESPGPGVFTQFFDNPPEPPKPAPAGPGEFTRWFDAAPGAQAKPVPQAPAKPVQERPLVTRISQPFPAKPVSQPLPPKAVSQKDEFEKLFAPNAAPSPPTAGTDDFDKLFGGNPAPGPFKPAIQSNNFRSPLDDTLMPESPRPASPRPPVRASAQPNWPVGPTMDEETGQFTRLFGSGPSGEAINIEEEQARAARSAQPEGRPFQAPTEFTRVFGPEAGGDTALPPPPRTMTGSASGLFASMPGKNVAAVPAKPSGPGEYTRITTRAELEAEQAARDKARAEQAPPAPLAARRGFAIGLAIGGAALVIAIIVVLVIVLRKH